MYIYYLDTKIVLLVFVLLTNIDNMYIRKSRAGEPEPV